MTKEINTDAELIGRLLTTRPTPAECLVSAARIEQLTAERDRYRKALEDIIKDYEPGYPLSHDVIKYVARAALKGENHD